MSAENHILFTAALAVSITLTVMLPTTERSEPPGSGEPVSQSTAKSDLNMANEKSGANNQQQSQSTAAVKGEAAESSANQTQQSSPALPPRQNEEIKSDEMSTYEKASLKIAERNFIVTAVGIGVAILVLILNWSQLRQMIATVTLNKQQLEGTQAAIVSPDITLLETLEVRVRLQNRGYVNALNATANLTITRKQLPERSTVGIPFHITIPNQPIPAAVRDVENPSVGDTFSIPGFTKNDWAAIFRLEQTVFIDGDYSYDNGFGRTIVQPIHLAYSVSQFLIDSNQHVVRPNSSGLVSIEQFETYYRNGVETKREAEAQMAGKTSGRG